MASVYPTELLKNDEFKSYLHAYFDVIIDDIIEAFVLTPRDFKRLYKEPDKLDENFLSILSVMTPQQFETVCYFLSKEVGASKCLDKIKEDLKHEAFVRGGLPKLSKKHIQRKTQVEEVKSSLEKLKPDGYLIIHGMIGYGKSSLLVQALEDSNLIYSQFQNKLFWIKLGEHLNTTNILQPMWKLYSTAVAYTTISPLTHCPETVEELRDALENLFIEDELKHSLIILDDVAFSKLVEQFDIRCKIVITTQEKIYLDNAEYINVNKGFTSEESLEVFSKYLGKDIPYIIIAERIHALCQGHPMIINLIGFYLESNKEMALHSVKIWDRAENILKTKSYDKLSYINKEINLCEILTLCINRLNSDLLKYYECLAIFPEDVNIMPNVLEVLWDVDEFRVREIMTELCDKSLAISFYHKDINSYIYGIHDLHLSYLKRKLNNKNELIKLHQKLISKYDSLTDQNLSRLPNDNYIIQYIAYHLKQADLLNRFDVFFDLKFLEMKIKHVGVADLLRDFKMYEKEITNNNYYKLKLLEEFKRFIQLNGSDLYCHQNTDIIQYALDEKKGSIYNVAIKFVINNPHRLYFNLQNNSEKINRSDILTVGEEITYACFYKNTENILVANFKGDIKHYFKHKLVHTYSGHTGKVVDIKYNPHKNQILSVSEEDKTARIWDLTSLKEDIVHSPLLKQANFKNFHEVPIKNTILKLEDPEDHIVSAAFSNTKMLGFIVTGSARGCITLWLDGKIQRSSTAQGYPLRCVKFTQNDDNILCIKNNNSVFIYYVENMSYSPLNFDAEDYISSIILVPNTKKFFAVTNSRVWECSWSDSLLKHNVIQNASNLDCAVVTPDSQYLVFCHDGNKISMRNIEFNNVVEEFTFSGKQALSLDTSFNDNSAANILLIGSDNKTLQQIQIQAHETAREKSRNASLLSCCWPTTQPLIASVDKNKCMEIQLGGVVFVQDNECVDNKITSLAFSSSYNSVYYGTDEGNVFEYFYKSKFHTRISMNFDNAIKDIRCFKYNGDIIICIDTKFNLKVYFTENENCFDYQLNGAPIYINYIFEMLFILDNTGKCYMYNIRENKWNCNKYFKSGGTVKFASVSTGSNYLGIIYNEGFKIFQLTNVEQFQFLEIYGELITNLTCCNFSFDGKYFAFGSETGEVSIIKMATKEKVGIKLYENPVHSFVFPDNTFPIMFCVGDQIACIDFSKLWNSKKKTVNNLGPYGKKIGDYNKPYLLSCLKLHGHSIKYISASPDFTSLVAADSDGKIYYLCMKE